MPSALDGMSAVLLAAELFGLLCAPCHGDGGRGDGPAAALYQPPPADLPRTVERLGGNPEALRALIVAGRPAIGMPSFASLSAADLDALVAHVRTLPGTPTAADHWATRPLPPQTPTAPIHGLEADRCARCHPAEHAAWQHSRHARATDPGVVGQYHGMSTTEIAACNACHAPLAEQQADRGLQAEGVTCAACHLRDGHKIGPLEPALNRLPAPGMRARPEPRFARADFCLPCHNLPLSAAVAGRPLLDTWREWAASPYLPAGVQCQHCHQPDGAHGFPGAHDAEMARRAVKLSVEGEGTRLAIRITNVGAGHHFPTTATPRAVLRARQLGPDGPVPDTEQSWAIGRTVEHRAGRWHEIADTRIPASQSRTWHYNLPRAPTAARIEISLHLFPDWFYARFYRAKLKRSNLTPAERRDFEAALAAAETSAMLLAYERRPLQPRELAK